MQKAPPPLLPLLSPRNCVLTKEAQICVCAQLRADDGHYMQHGDNGKKKKKAGVANCAREMASGAGKKTARMRTGKPLSAVLCPKGAERERSPVAKEIRPD